VNWFHLGADPEIDQSGPLAPHKANLEEFKILASKPSFLSVGTLEPRKGHEQVLDSFEQLWEQGIDINLVFVGKQGWKVESLINRLKNHPEKSRRLFWFDGISDLHLNEIYQTCSCLIAASEGEGFGLPLIEAAHHGIPILARSIPVFHEVAGPNAFYFEGKHPQHLASAVQEWLQLSSKNKLVSSKDLPWLTWAQSAKRLEQALCLDGSRSKVL